MKTWDVRISKFAYVDNLPVASTTATITDHRTGSKVEVYAETDSAMLVPNPFNLGNRYMVSLPAGRYNVLIEAEGFEPVTVVLSVPGDLLEEEDLERRMRFLAGIGTLAAEEVVDWARELGAGEGDLPSKYTDLSIYGNLMVSVVHKQEKWT